MDNLDMMITEALAGECEPDEYLVQRTLSLINQNRKQNIIAVNLIFLVNMLGIVLIGMVSALLPPVFRAAGCLFVLMWLAAIIPVYIIARFKFSRI